jgi:hypothetical protein
MRDVGPVRALRIDVGSARGTHHSKFLLVFGAKWLRVIVMTGNPSAFEQEAMGQCAWAQDFPAVDVGARLFFFFFFFFFLPP